MITATTTVPSSVPTPQLLQQVVEVIETRSVRAVYQPIVDLDTGAVVAYEALARGPEGSPLESPAVLFAAAEAAGRLAELDWVCRAAAFAGALGSINPSTSLFVNSEPAALGSPCPRDLAGVVARAEERLRVVVELTERALPANPPGVLAAVEHARSFMWAVALDDVGANPDSLAMMPFVRPDVVKLDMGLIQGRTTRYVAGIMSAVLAYAERSGAVVLAEGIEDERHLALARSLGATLGQGWHFGRPGPLPTVQERPRTVVPILDRPSAPVHRSAFDLVRGVRTPRRATKQTLLNFSLQLEQHGVDNDDSPVLLSCFQDANRFTPATRDRYRGLVDRCALVAALGHAMPEEPAAGVRGGHLTGDDPLRDEWTVVVVSPHFSGALIARDVGDDGPDLERRFDYVITHDRELVTEAARIMLGRIVPAI